MRPGVLLALALLAGCGQKGPLYFAPAETPSLTPAAQSAGGQQQDESADRQDNED